MVLWVVLLLVPATLLLMKVVKEPPRSMDRFVEGKICSVCTTKGQNKLVPDWYYKVIVCIEGETVEISSCIRANILAYLLRQNQIAFVWYDSSDPNRYKVVYTIPDLAELVGTMLLATGAIVAGVLLIVRSYL